MQGDLRLQVYLAHQQHSAPPPPLTTITMFSRLAAISVAALPILAAATPVELQARQSCSTGPIQCCQQVQSVSGFRHSFPCLTLMLTLDTRHAG